MPDKNEIIRALRLWFQSGDVFEIRVLDAVTAEWMRPHTESGYFDYEHIPDAADAIGKLRSYRGAYATVNPVNPDLLARACNRIRAVLKDPTTADTDILRRRWFLIDCDAKRPTGVSSSDEEHAAALKKACELRDDLASMGWPEPVMTDSGNGAQMMYLIDLPADDGNLVHQCIEALKKAGNDRVSIDRSVFNPARIWRIPGTMNCKGDSVPSRPHRMAKIISAPEHLTAVTREQLDKVAEYAEVAPANLESRIVSDIFVIDDWIRQHCPELGAPQTWKGGRRWVFPVCPFNPAHSNKSAVLIEQPSGAIAFKCHHDGCSGNDWPKLRELLEPGCYDHPTDDSDVNIDWILAQKPKPDVVVPHAEIIIPPEPEIIRPWRDISSGDIKEMLRGTYLGELATLYSCVTRPPLPIEAALLKAIVTAACCLTGEASTEELQRRYGTLGGLRPIGADRAKLKINTAGGQVCNVYAMVVANSASGKDIGNLIGKFARMNNPSIRNADGEHVIADWNLGTSGSAEGLANVLTKKPNGLLTISEMQNWLDPHHWQNKATSFLTETFGQGYYDQNFSERGRGSSTRSVDYCCPNIIANIQPKVFTELVDMQNIYTGFLGRFIFAVMPEFYGNPARFDSAAVMEQMHVIVDVFLRKKGSVELDEDYSDDLQKVFLGNCDPKLNPSWRRLCCEYYPRFMVMLSVNHGIKSQGESVVITDEAVSKARTLTMWLFAQAERVLGDVMDCDARSRETEQKLKRIFEIVRDSDRGDGVLTSEISKRASGSGTTAKQRQEILLELKEREWIRFDGSRFSVLNPPPGMERVRKKFRKG